MRYLRLFLDLLIVFVFVVIFVSCKGENGKGFICGDIVAVAEIGYGCYVIMDYVEEDNHTLYLSPVDCNYDLSESEIFCSDDLISEI